MIRCLIFVSALFFAGALSAQSQRGTMRFDLTEWDFGRIDELGGKVSHVFEFTNTGREPFVIENVSTSCGCTTPEYTRSPVLPGGKGRVTVTFDPEGQPGAVRKEVYIQSDNRRNRNTLTIRGEVNPRPRTVEDQYPVQLGNGIRVDFVEAAFEYIPRGATKSMIINYYNAGNSTATLSVRPETTASYFKASLSRANIGPKERGVMTLTYDLRAADLWGRVSNRFDLIVNGEASPLKFSANGIAVDDFTKMTPLELAIAPKGSIPLLYHNFEAVAPGSANTAEFTMTNEGEPPLEVRYVKCGEGVSTDLKVGETLRSGQHRSFRVTLTANGRAGDKVNGEMTVIFNDPARPFREFRLAATIR